MNLSEIGDIILALGIIAGIVVFVRANANYLPREEKVDD